MEVLANRFAYINVSNQHIICLTLTQYYMSIINKAGNKETTLEKQNDFLFYYGLKKTKIF